MNNNFMPCCMNHSPSDVLFVTAETGYVANGLKAAGYSVENPYSYKTLYGRLVLEIASRLKLPAYFIYNKHIIDVQCKYIIIYDSIITNDFLKWLCKVKANAILIFVYTNLIGKAHHLLPCDIPPVIKVWTYDYNDSKKYNINLFTCGGYFPSYVRKACRKKYDVFYAGRDKGRANYILTLQEKFKECGLKTKLLIMPDTRFSKKKPFYSSMLSYEDIVNYVAESKAVLNVTLEGQTGITMRDYEAIFNNVKLITTNHQIKNADFYICDNVFILGEQDIDGLPFFLSKPCIPVSINILRHHTIWAQVCEFISGVNT